VVLQAQATRIIRCPHGIGNNMVLAKGLSISQSEDTVSQRFLDLVNRNNA
jgi:hypothetical protein